MARQITLATALVLIIIAGALGVGYWASKTPEPTTNTNTITAPTTPATNTGASNVANTNTVAPSSTNKNTNTTAINDSAANVPAPATNNSSYSLDTVATHATDSDCWLVIENKVYDVTAFIPEHPGGKRITQGCGKDATDLFTGTSRLGRMHSAVARKMLAKYQIGTLQ